LKLASLAERDISSSGYVVDTLTAGVWCLLTSKNYRETVLKAVNLGGDTDTTGIVAGGLAGIQGGLATVPENWRNAMARAGDLTTLFEQFAASCS
jgi:ADP-ribosylglycohydrolase